MIGFTKVAVTLLALCALSEAKSKPEKHHHGKKDKSLMRSRKQAKEETVLVELGASGTEEIEDSHHSAVDYAALAEQVARMERQLVDAHMTNKDLARKLKKHRAPAHEEKGAESEEEELSEKVHKKNDDAIAKSDGDKDGDDKSEGGGGGEDHDSEDALSPAEKAEEAEKEEELGSAYKAGVKAGKKECGGGDKDDDKSESLLDGDDENFVGASSHKNLLISDNLNAAEKQLSKARRMLQLARKKFPEHRLTEANLDSLMESDTKDGSWGGRRRCNINTNSVCYCATRRRGSGSWLQQSGEDGSDSASLLESEDQEAMGALEEAAEEGGSKSGWGGRRRCFASNTYTDCGGDGDCIDSI